MPIRKFHSIAEMKPLPPRRPLDPDNLRVALELIGLVYGLRPWHFPPGVHKFRSLEEKDRHRDDWERSQRAGLGPPKGLSSTP